MEVTLKCLELTNYRNISHAIYSFDGNSKIVGENRIGKTNTLEAIMFLLTDKLLNGSSDIAQIKPLDDTKKEVRVEGTFLVGDKEITIRKDYGEDWVKTKGLDELVFKGHYLTYYYNGVKQKTQKDFYALFNEDFGINGDFRNIDLTQLLVDPFYLGNLGEGEKWKDLRTFIISLIGDVSDADVFEKDSKLIGLKDDLALRSGRIDELKKYYQNEIKGLNDQIIGDDAQIELLEKTPRPTDEEIAIAKKGIKDLDEEIASLQGKLSSDALVLQIEKDINDNKGKILEIERANLSAKGNSELKIKLEQENAKYRELLSKKAQLKEELAAKGRDIERTNEELEICANNKRTYVEKLRAIDEELAKPFDAICPTCHRPLEGEELEKAKAKFQKDLLDSKDYLLNQGKANKQKRETLSLCLENLNLDVTNLEGELDNVLLEIKETLEVIEETGNKLKEEENTVVEIDPEVARLENEILILEKKKRQVIADNAALDIEVKERIEEKNEQKATFQKVLDDYNYFVRQQGQLEYVKGLKKEHTTRLAKFEQKKELINAFIKTKLQMLDENVARVFGNIKFQLIKENINGGYDPICKPYIYDIDKDASTNVTWKSGSKSERVITGIAICERVKVALGLNDLPFLFDEGGEISTETFNTKFKTNSQLICVKVMDNIKTPMVMKI